MKTKYSATELAKILADHKLYLNGDPAGIRAVLRGAYLGGADLTGADLTGADLTGADLGGAYLTGADLYGADLTRAVLRGANLRGADLTRAVLRGANLRGAYLGGADLTGADLGAKTVMGRMLRLLGACEDSVQWVESKPKKSIAALVKEARKDHPDWIQWAVARGIIAEEK